MIYYVISVRRNKYIYIIVQTGALRAMQQSERERQTNAKNAYFLQTLAHIYNVMQIITDKTHAHKTL